MTVLERVVEHLAGVTPDYIDEYTLQAQLHDVLEQAGFYVKREHPLSDGVSRIDLLVLGADTVVGIEVKVDGRWPDVMRQLTRYAECPELDALILVTTRAKHHHVPTDIDGKPVRLVTYVTAGL